jgi:nitrogen-specific signal transduction histidine kinase
MATPEMGSSALQVFPAKGKRTVAARGRPETRLLLAERSEEIFPILVEEIVELGFPRALVAAVDFDSGDIAPVAALNCSQGFQQRFTSALWRGGNPMVDALRAMTPVILPKTSKNQPAVYSHPLIYRSESLCWEAERERRQECLALRNCQHAAPLDLQQQVCATCNMRAYVAAVIVELPRNHSNSQMAELRELIELSSRYLSRLFKVDHYYNRMRDSDVIIAQMGTLMQSMADPVILTDSQHRVVTQNKAAERFFKVPNDVTEGAARAVELNNMLFSAALSSMAVSGSSDATRDLTLVDVEEGEEVLFEAVTAPSFSTDGMRTGLVTVMRDVTDLRRADQEVRANLERLREAQEIVRQDRDRLNLVIENVGDPIIVADGGAKVVLLDPLAQELFGKASEATAGLNRMAAENPKIIKNQVALDSYLTNFTFAFSNKHNSTIRVWHPGSKAEVEYDTRSGKIYDKRGSVAFTITVLRDLSALRKLEQLKMERRMLEIEKFAATGRMAGTIAHEVNNPMEAIKNSIFLLNGRVLPEGQPVLDILKSETDRVSRIVRQMLGLYRHSEAVGTIDVNNVVEDSLALFARQIERAGIRVEKDLGNLPLIVGSPDQFRQVVSNLVVNAKDSMTPPSPAEGDSAREGAPAVLKIRTHHVPAQDGVHGWVTVLLADTGTGIPPELVRTIFEPFVSTKGEKGTGLGLWIVRGIVESHGGKMRVRSKVGAGTVFKIDFPVVK